MAIYINITSLVVKNTKLRMETLLQKDLTLTKEPMKLFFVLAILKIQAK